MRLRCPSSTQKSCEKQDPLPQDTDAGFFLHSMTIRRRTSSPGSQQTFSHTASLRGDWHVCDLPKAASDCPSCRRDDQTKDTNTSGNIHRPPHVDSETNLLDWFDRNRNTLPKYQVDHLIEASHPLKSSSIPVAFPTENGLRSWRRCHSFKSRARYLRSKTTSL
jgi:hypothetical protein